MTVWLVLLNNVSSYQRKIWPFALKSYPISSEVLSFEESEFRNFTDGNINKPKKQKSDCLHDRISIRMWLYQPKFSLNKIPTPRLMVIYTVFKFYLYSYIQFHLNLIRIWLWTFLDSTIGINTRNNSITQKCYYRFINQCELYYVIPFIFKCAL